MTASQDNVNPRIQQTRDGRQWLYDWWRRIRILINIGFLVAYMTVLHVFGVLRTYSTLFYGQYTPDNQLIFDQNEVKLVVIKTVYFVLITIAFGAATFYLPSGKVRRDSSS